MTHSFAGDIVKVSHARVRHTDDKQSTITVVIPPTDNDTALLLGRLIGKPVKFIVAVEP